MASLKIARLGNPILRQMAEPVDLEELKNPNSEVQHFIEEMIEVMRVEGGVGLAAPQVSRSVRIVVLESQDNPRYSDRADFSLMVLINPNITRYSEHRVWGWESCLSLIDFRGWVPRANKVTVETYDRQGKPLIIEAEDFQAVVLQHEIDHLNGLLFIDRMPDMKKLAYQEEFKAFWIKDPKESTQVSPNH